MGLIEADMFTAGATALAFVAGSLAMQSVMLWRWERRLNAGRFDAGLQRACVAAAPSIVGALVDAVADTLAERLRLAIIGKAGGAASAEARRAGKLEGDLSEALLAEAGAVDLGDVLRAADPEWGGAAARMLRKNPRLAALLGDIIQAKASTLAARHGANGHAAAEEGVSVAVGGLK